MATENGASTPDPWILAPTSAAVPRRGGLALRLHGTVQPITDWTGGSVTFRVVGLSLLFTPQTSGKASVREPAAVHLDCTLDPGQATTLATVPVIANTGGRYAAATTSTATPWTVAPGGSVTGSASGSLGLSTFTDTTTGAVVTCKSSSLNSTFKSGRELSSADIASMSSVSFSTCSGPGKKSFTLTTSASAGNPWRLNAQSFDSSTDLTTVTMSNMMASISATGCSATVAGPGASTPGLVEAGNSINQFTLADTLQVNPTGGDLHIWDVKGCTGIFGNGNGLTFTVPYTISPAQYVVPTYCPPFPIKTGFPFNKLFKFPPYPKGSTVTTAPPLPTEQGCAYIEGFSNVAKLHGAALVGPGFGNIQVSRRTIIDNKCPPHEKHCPGYLQSDSSGQLYYKPCPGSAPQCRPVNGLPPSKATLLGFGFMPITATLQVTQIGNLDIATVGTSLTHVLRYSKIMSEDVIRIEDVTVNGVPLNVGNQCQSAPFKLVLIGKPPYELQTGGVLSGTINIPAFSGCGSGENLDSIFTASVSGPGNFVKLVQGSLCTDWPIPPFPPGCPAAVPEPIH